MVLLGRIELPASPLPRECSTTELQQPLNAYHAISKDLGGHLYMYICTTRLVRALTISLPSDFQEETVQIS